MDDHMCDPTRAGWRQHADIGRAAQGGSAPNAQETVVVSFGPIRDTVANHYVWPIRLAHYVTVSFGPIRVTTSFGPFVTAAVAMTRGRG